MSVLLVWAITTTMASGATALPHAVGLARIVPLDWWLHPVGWGIATALYGVAWLAFLFRVREDTAGWVLFGMMGLCVTIEMSVRHIFMPQLESMAAGAVMSAWLVGRLYGRWRGRPEAELDHLGNEAAAGVLGAALFLAAASKIWASGGAWVGGAIHCVTIYEHDLLSPGSIWSPLRQVVVTQPWICSAGAVGVLVVEFGAVAMFFPKLRKVFAVTVVWLFVSLHVFYGIEELSWTALTVGLAWSHLGRPPGWPAEVTAFAGASPADSVFAHPSTFDRQPDRKNPL